MHTSINLCNLQIDYIRRRQHISTIDTNSPTKRLLTGAPLSHTHAPSDFSMHSNHSNLGYCTLRNGNHVPSSYENTISMVRYKLSILKNTKYIISI